MKHLISVYSLFVSFSSMAQLTINNTLYTQSQLVSNVLAPTGNGVTISNVTFRGVYNVSSRYQVGYFSASGSVQTNLEMASGILLTSGNTSEIPMSDLVTHPGSASQVSRNFVSGTTGEIRSSNAASGQDADVGVLCSPYNYFNAAILEFDFVPANSNVSFRYTFGSEEYMDNGGFINYNCSSYNDHFGFLLSGPGITGGAGFSNNAVNIAQLSNGSAVSINAVNNGVVGSSGGAPSAAKCQSANASWVQNTQSAEFKGPIYGIHFNGNTKVLTASRSGLTVGSTYHIRLIVSDVGDGAYDSGVFLEAGSFSSPITLPVDYNNFNADCINAGALVHWTTSEEKSNMLFQIQRSEDGIHFETIKSIIGKGQSSNLMSYSMVDSSMVAECYYRIKQTDRDGSTGFSEIIYFKRSCENNLDQLHVFPNPAQNTITINLNNTEDSPTNFKIINSIGQCVLNLLPPTVLLDGKLLIQVDISSLQNGLYYIILEGKNTGTSSKLIVARP